MREKALVCWSGHSVGGGGGGGARGGRGGVSLSLWVESSLVVGYTTLKGEEEGRDSPTDRP